MRCLGCFLQFIYCTMTGAIIVLFTCSSVLAATLELHANFNTIGITVRDPDSTTAAVKYKKIDESVFHVGHPLVRVQGVSSPRLVGSLFNLSSDTTYIVKVTFSENTDLEQQVTTRSESELNIPSNLTKRYVSPDGSGTRCTASSPCSLDYAKKYFSEGNNEILLYDGIYYAGGFTITGEKTVIRAVQGHSPVIDGRSPESFSWYDKPTAGSVELSGVYCTMLEPETLLQETWYAPFDRGAMILHNGLRLYPFQSWSELNNLAVDAERSEGSDNISIDTGGFLINNNELCAHLPGDVQPETKENEISISIYPFAFRVRAEHVYFKGIKFQYFGHGHRGKAIRLDPVGSDEDDLEATHTRNALISENTFYINDIGVAVGIDADFNVIQDNEFEDNVHQWPWDAIKLLGNNYLSELEGGGVFFSSGVPTKFLAQGNVIRRNTFKGFFDGAHICPFNGSNDEYYYPGFTETNETDFHDNEIYNISDDGIETDGYSSNVRIWGNRFHNIYSAISVAPALGGPTYLIRNLAYNLLPGVVRGETDYGQTLKFIYSMQSMTGQNAPRVCEDDPYESACIGPLFFYHNTLDATKNCNESNGRCHYGLNLLSQNSSGKEFVRSTTIKSRNNIFMGSKQGILKITPYSVDRGLDFDFDNIRVTSDNEVIEWETTDRTDDSYPLDWCPQKEYSSLNDFAKCENRETHGNEFLPEFTNVIQGNYELKERSQLIDAGEWVPGINDDYEGLAPDIGAFESDNELSGLRAYYPYIVCVDGWNSDIGIVNKNSSEKLEGVLRAYDEKGSALSEIPIQLEPEGRLEIYVAEEFSNPQSIRYIVLDVNHGDFTGYERLAKNGIYSVALSAFSDTEINSSDIHVSHIASTNTAPKWTTTLSLLNTSNHKRTVEITFNTGEQKAITLEPMQFKAFTIAELFGGEPQPEITSASIAKAGGCIGVELFCNESNNILSGISLKDDLTDQMYFPHIAIKDGWGTGVVAYNSSPDDIELTVTPYDETGNALGSVTETVLGRERYFGVVSKLGLPDETAWIDVKTNAKVLTGFELFTQENQMAGYTGVDIYGQVGVFPKVKSNEHTGIAFVNIDEGTATVNLVAHDDSGKTIASQKMNLNKYEKFVDLAQNIFTADISKATYIKYSSDKNIVGFQLNLSDDLMMLDGLPAK